MKKSFALLNREFILARSSLSNLVFHLFYFAAILFLFLMILEDVLLQKSDHLPAIAFAVMALVAFIGGNKMLEEDIQNHQIENFMLLDVSLVFVVFFKAASYWFFYLLPQLVFAFLASYFMKGLGGAEFIDIAVGSFLLSFLTTFSTALIASSKQKSFLGVLILVPLCVPLFVLVSLKVKGFEPGSVDALLVAYTLFVIPVLSLAGCFALKQEVASK